MKLAKFTANYDSIRRLRAMAAWKEYCMTKERNSLRLKKIDASRNKQIKLKVWKSLKKNVRDYKLSDKELAVS